MIISREKLLSLAFGLLGSSGFLWSPGLGAQDSALSRGSEPGESLQVFLMTMGPGDAVWERFSHNAIWIRDGETGWEAAYNWGVFDFGQVDFIPRLAKGTMMYRMAAYYDPEALVEEYRRRDRKVWVQELALTPAQKTALRDFAEWNALPENVYYRYDYYRDNCSTRVRDALDRVLGGRIRAASEPDTTPHSFRWHTRRLLGDRPPPYLGIQFVLGPRADRPITGWEEMFLPLRLMERIRDVQVPDGEGGTRPLVLRETVLLETSRPPVPQEPPFGLPWFLGTGLLWGGGILWLSRGVESGGWIRRAGLTILAGGWTLLAAVGGSLLLAAWLFTDHAFWYRNLNLFQVNPAFFPLPAAFLVFLLRDRFPGWGKSLAGVLALLSMAGAVVSFLPGLGQGNGEILALFLPLNLSLWVASSRLREDPAEGGSPGDHGS